MIPVASAVFLLGGRHLCIDFVLLVVVVFLVLVVVVDRRRLLLLRHVHATVSVCDWQESWRLRVWACTRHVFFSSFLFSSLVFKLFIACNFVGLPDKHTRASVVLG